MDTTPRPPDSIRVTRVRLEAASICQLKCPTCPTTEGSVASNIGVGVLKFSNFEKFVRNNSQLKEIELSNWGEIFLNKELLEIIKLASALQINLVARNGVNLNHASNEILESLVKYRFLAITVSLDGASQATYSQYRRQGDFDRVIERVEKINQFKLEYGSPYPELSWQFVVSEHNKHEIDVAKEMATRLGMTIRFKLNWDDQAAPRGDAEAVRAATGLSAISRQEYEQKNALPYLVSICDQLWSDPQIHHDGKMLGCCANYWGDFGNVFEDGLDAVVNGERMRFARRMLTGEVSARADIPCTNCHRYLRMVEKQSFIPPKEN